LNGGSMVNTLHP